MRSVTCSQIEGSHTNPTKFCGIIYEKVSTKLCFPTMRKFSFFDLFKVNADVHALIIMQRIGIGKESELTSARIRTM